MKVFDLKPELVTEMSLVFKSFGGKEYAPRNPEAMILAVKGGLKEKALGAIETLKGYFSSNDDLPDDATFPVASADDTIDNDGDGPEDYNEIAAALCKVACDIQAAFNIMDDDARSKAIVGAIDSFLDQLDDFRGEDDDAEKAGARHSENDMAHLTTIADTTAKIGEHIEAIQGSLKNLGVTAAQGPVEAKQGDEQDSGPENSQVDDDANKAEPITVVTPIENKAEEIDMTQDEIDAKIAQAVAEGVAKAAAQAKADSDAALAAKDAEVVAAKAAQAASDAALREQVSKPVAMSAFKATGSSNRLAGLMIAEMRNNPESPRI